MDKGKPDSQFEMDIRSINNGKFTFEWYLKCKTGTSLIIFNHRPLNFACFSTWAQ